ncbi:MAG: hypothetical protein Kow0077_32240 [Anaerolineae bacterium]
MGDLIAQFVTHPLVLAICAGVCSIVLWAGWFYFLFGLTRKQRRRLVREFMIDPEDAARIAVMWHLLDDD